MNITEKNLPDNHCCKKNTVLVNELLDAQERTYIQVSISENTDNKTQLCNFPVTLETN